MVEQKKTKRERDIKSKLMAAIAMLLVSSIMMVSTTYAWFTLSTAPEVTGITTAVGANGNLEMALMPYKIDANTYSTVADALGAITSGTGDSLLPATEKNVTWGNLVDLSDSSYALDKISLYPSSLDFAAGKIADNYLATPQYGSDGRVTTMAHTAMARLYENAVFGTENAYGVRAVGVSSGMSGREQAYRSALSSANAAAAKANTAASASMAQGGTSLASIGMKKAQNSAATYTVADLTNLRTALYALIDSKTGALTYAETAMIQYLLADALGTTSDAEFPGILTAFDSIQTLSDTALTGYINAAGVATQANALTALKTKVSDAVDDVDALIEQNKESYAWSEISSYVMMLGDTDTMTLCGQPLKYWLERDDSNQFKHINELMANVSNLVLVLQPSADQSKGVYIELADIVGYFESEVTFNNLQFGGWDLGGLKARMQVNPAVNPTHLAAVKNAANGATFEGGGSAISDFYGYIIDLAFRTNAADSNLMLQTDSIDRIYADSDVNANTMGGGSTMSFSMVGLQNFNVTQVANLMSYIRIVFFDPTTMSIYGEARLDFNKVTNQDGRELILTNGKYEQEITVTAEDGSTSTHIGYLSMNTTTGTTEEVQVTEISMAMKMWDNEANPNYEKNEDGSIKKDENGNEIITSYNGGWAADSKIMSLVQNTATAVSALVYMDGEKITNKDASTAGITGTMNIQFASSATLTPMEYGDLRQPAEEQTTKEYKVTINGADTGKTVQDGQKLEFTIPDTYANYNVTKIMMGDTDVTSSLVNGKLTIDAVTGDIEITATAPAGT